MTNEIMVKNYEEAKQENKEGKVEGKKETLSGKWKSEPIYLLMKAYVEAGLAENAIKKCDASYQIDLLD